MAAEAETEDTRPEHQLFPIIGRLCTLRATLEKSESRDIRVLTIANGIDSDLEDWKNRLPPVFSYSRMQTAANEYVFSNTYHVYSNTWTISIWNLYRCARIFTHLVILGWLDRNSIPNAALERSQRRQSEVVLADLAHKICASAPFILGVSPSHIESSRAPSAATVLALRWPLYLAASIDQQVSGRRAWIITRLELIGRTLGITQAES